MPIPSNPPFLTNVIGYAAEVNNIPATTPAGSGQLSYQSAFPAATSVPLTAGGVAPARKDFNAVIKLLSQHVYFQQSGSLYVWSSSLDYLKGAHILGSNGQGYVAVQSSGPSTSAGAKNPVSDSSQTYWKLASAGTEGSGVPLGTIVAFSGTFGGTGNRFPIPLGESEPDLNWCICDGTTTNGLPVPDLRGRFIMGANDKYKAGSTGGSATHSHSVSGTVDKTTLKISQMPAHAHPYLPLRVYYGGQGIDGQGWHTEKNEETTGSTGGSTSHTHSYSGTSGSASSLSPYYALSYIMRIS